MGATGRLELRRTADRYEVQLDDDGNPMQDDDGLAVLVLDDQGDPKLVKKGTWKVTSHDLPELHHFGMDLFVRFMADGVVQGNEIVFEGPDEGTSVRYRILPPDENGPKEATSLYAVLVGSAADTPERVGGVNSFNAWRDHDDDAGKIGSVKYVKTADHVAGSTPEGGTDTDG